ncbi:MULTISPECIES: hypothetical protein [Metallosphaera]|uniref:Uncharacterized protein n=1 Tax=Metallosphaera cuprina (strain Ar-4) TaxID=1006006 RepID=F4G374_METCR|nr:hypothetical protein [Metallosphaera cuprina]AEB95272.1 conserved hypothetical protein [Metallosphaera cuprina Ar-4]
MDSKFLFKGNLVSLIASLIILAGLVLLEINGISFALSGTFLAIMTVVWILAIPSLVSYHRSKLERRWILDFFGIAAMVITLVGLILAYQRSFLGVEIIVLGYTLEPIAGISIYLTANKISKLYSSLFFWGAVVFTFGLPLYFFNLGDISIFGDVVKMVGIVMLMRSYLLSNLTKR